MRLFLTVVVLVATVVAASAGDIDDAGFDLRFSAAITRYPRYADIAGFGGPSAGSPYSSAINPAGQAFRPAVGANGLGSSVQYSSLLTEEGTVVHAGSLSLALDAGDWGIFQPSFLELGSNRSTMRNGLDFEWRGWSAEIQWARKIDPSTSVGVNASVLASRIDLSLDSMDVSRSESTTWQIRLGVLHAFGERLFGGIALDYAVSPSRTRFPDFLGLGIGTLTERETSHQMVFRPGIYTYLTDDLTLYADYQLAAFASDSGILVVHRFYAGLDQTLTRGLFLRAGAVVDTEGHVSVAAGVGLAPSESVYVDLSYEYDMFPELDAEFGRADLLGVGFTLLF